MDESRVDSIFFKEECSSAEYLIPVSEIDVSAFTTIDDEYRVLRMTGRDDLVEVFRRAEATVIATLALPAHATRRDMHDVEREIERGRIKREWDSEEGARPGRALVGPRPKIPLTEVNPEFPLAELRGTTPVLACPECQ